MNEALRAIALADDRTIVRAFEHLHGLLSDALEVSLGDLGDGLGPAASELVSLFRSREDEPLSAGASVALARWLLVAAADDARFAPLVLRALQEWPDDRQSVGKILTIGLVGAVWLIVATTDVHVQGDEFEITKHGVVPAAVEVSASSFKSKFDLRIRAESDGTEDATKDGERHRTTESKQ